MVYIEKERIDMICDKNTLKRILKKEKEAYLGDSFFRHFLAHTKNYVIWKWQHHLRNEEFYSNKHDILSKAMFLWHKRRKNILAQKLGFDIPANCFDEGLLIHHVSPITVNESARIGKNCDIAGSICIGSKGNSTPVIGDNCNIGYGAIILGG